MHSNRLNMHPRVVAHHDGGQTDGLFYLSGPIDYKAVAAEPMMYEREREKLWGKGQLTQEASIIFSMEEIEKLAMTEGSPDELLTLEGPTRNDGQGRFDEHIQGWFDGQKDGVATARIQLPRGMVQDLWMSGKEGELMEAVTDFIEGVDEDDRIGKMRVLEKVLGLLRG